MSDPVYCYPPDHLVLRNRVGLRDAVQLDRFERRAVLQRISEGVPTGHFDLAHLRSIHHHLFQDVYDWAGEIRTVEIAKGGNQFQFRRFIETGIADIHRRLMARRYLEGLSVDAFAEQAGEIVGDVNYVHPFREGNGRVQALYLEQLARRAGHPLELRRIAKDRWLAASKAAHAGRYELLSGCIRGAIDAPL